MKPILVSLFLLSTFVGWGQSVDLTSSDITQDINGVVLLNEKPLNGVGYTLFDNGDTSEISTYTNGRIDGYRKVFNQDGRLNQYVEFSDGQMDGSCISYYPDGGEWVHYHLVDNRPVGEYTVYHSNGKVNLQMIYENGEPVRPFKYFDSQGNPITEREYCLSDELFNSMNCKVKVVLDGVFVNRTTENKLGEESVDNLLVNQICWLTFIVKGDTQLFTVVYFQGDSETMSSGEVEYTDESWFVPLNENCNIEVMGGY